MEEALGWGKPYILFQIQIDFSFILPEWTVRRACFYNLIQL